jgi:ferric-dicitrate binding protein FerR (iron transport regulator)
MGGDASDAGAEETRVLREGLQVNRLSPEAMARIRAAVEPVWRARVQRPQRRWPRFAIASSVLGLVLLGGGLMSQLNVRDGEGEIAAHLLRSDQRGMVETRAFRRGVGLSEGAVLRSAHSFRSSGQSLLALEGGGNLRVAAGSEFEILGSNALRLDAGEFYVDIPPGSHGSSAFTVRTAAGEFRHVGTQFAVAVSQGQTRLRVREGSVHWLIANQESTVAAGSEVIFANDAKISERQISTSDVVWDWIADTTPDFEIDNRPLGDFLEWVARESGRKLVLADDETREQAARVRMHGSVHGLTPMQALSAVMATTELRYDLPDGQIRVSFASGTIRHK